MTVELRAEHPTTPGPPDDDVLLSVRGLRVGFPTRSGVATVVNNVDLTLGRGEVLGLVGESGSGKSVTCRALIGVVPHPGAILGGTITFDGRELTAMDRAELRRVRAHEIAMIFQDSIELAQPRVLDRPPGRRGAPGEPRDESQGRATTVRRAPRPRRDPGATGTDARPTPTS